jgi:hypothetical protein
MKKLKSAEGQNTKLVINGLEFAKNSSEFTDTVFRKGGTAYGYYKKLKNHIHLMDMRGKIFAAIICTPDFQGIVDASKINGLVFYKHAATDKTKKLLGVPKKCLDTFAYAQSIYNQV